MDKRFRVALSFAGEKRDFVAKVATILAGHFGEDRILYDKFHEAEFARDELAIRLPKLYHNEADLIVAVLCRDYAGKEWCGLEWKAVYGLIKQRKSDEIMLSRFDRVDMPELFGLAGFVELDEMTPAGAAHLILQRLAINEGLPKGHYISTGSMSPPAPEWPEVAPQLDWRLADHRDAQRTFSQLITRAAPFRVLCIHGESGTGKSHLTNQYLRHGLNIPGLVCGRLDFKGSAGIGDELRRFAEHLEVEMPGGGASVSSQLAHILSVLKSQAKPTLLIFDTFEEAGDAERWVKDFLLLTVVRTPWLRVVIVGRSPTKSYGAPWEKVGSSVKLQPPEPEDWFEYSREHRPEVTIDEVRTAHKLAGGSSTLLAQLLGPRA